MILWFIQIVAMETFDLWEEPVLLEEWRSAGTMHGAQCVTTSGVRQMLWSLAGSLASVMQV